MDSERTRFDRWFRYIFLACPLPPPFPFIILLIFNFQMFFNRVKSVLLYSWTYLWLFWFLLIIVLIYVLRGPLKITESFENGKYWNITTASCFNLMFLASSYFNNLTPKFYVALTGTSSLVSGIILIFEWWYFRKWVLCASGFYAKSNIKIAIRTTQPFWRKNYVSEL